MNTFLIALVLAAATDAVPVLGLRAAVTGSASGGLTITLSRWSSEAERAPVLAAFSPPAPAPAPAGPVAAGRAGRAGRAGGRAAAPPSPGARLSAAIKAAPTLGYVWGDGVTGYSIKYAWRAPEAGAAGRIVLITDRRLGAHAPAWALGPGPLADAEFTLIEIRMDATGAGEGKTSLTANVVVDPAAKTLALDGYAAAPALLRISR